jgi:alpha-glucoside transport system substrate-binding protein
VASVSTRFSRFRILSFMALLSLLATACLGGDGGGGTAEGGSEGGGGGGSVEIMGAFVDDEAEDFRLALEPLINEGVDVTYSPTPDFNTLITTRVEGGDPPDIALFPQPGLLLDIANETDAVPVSEYLDVDALEQSLIPGFLDAVTDDEGEVRGFPMRMAVKSALWYPKPAFEEAGYAVPETQEDLVALEEQIRSDGNTPWCLGMGAGDATGWVGTDWVEEYMLRLHGPEVYDQWVSHDVVFDSPEVTQAFETFGELWQTEGNVVGGSQGMLSIDADASTAGLFEDPPQCYMHRQGNFATAFFPDDVQENLDENVGVAYFPEDTSGYDGKPVLAGGDLALLLNDTPAARQTMEFLAQENFGEAWAQAGGWLSPHVGFDPENYPTQVEKDLFAIGAEADILRFDASDLMPGAVGAGSFWTGIVDWVGGQKDLQTVLQEIDGSWPSQ